MANTISCSLIVPVTGDGVSTSCAVNLGYTPTAASATAAYDSTGNSVLSNISSVVPGTYSVTINFAAAFNGVVQVVLALSNSKSAASSVQNLKDSGRTQVTLFADNITGVTTEALATMSITKGVVAQTAATSYTVTSGKTFRVQAIFVEAHATSTTATQSRVRLRSAASSLLATSPILALVSVTSRTAVADSGQAEQFNFPDGLEIAGGTVVGFSHIESTTSSAVSVCIVGFEY